MNTTGKIVVGVLAGVAVGALLGVLFAPERGSDTRRMIAKRSSNTVNDIKNKFEDLKDGVIEKFEEGKEEVAGAYGRVKSKFEEFKKEGKSA